MIVFVVLFLSNFFIPQAAATVFSGDTMENVLKDIIKPLVGESGLTTSDSIIDVIMAWLVWALPFAGVASFAGIIYAGFLYLTAFAKDDQVKKAKDILAWSVIGLILIFIAYAIVSTFITPTG